MAEHPEAKAVLAVRPDFYGMECDLAGLSQAARERGMLTLCDEAHGACFNWDVASRNALQCGADLAVQSAHKTLPALNAGAWLHGAEGVDAPRLRRLLRMVQTSSPSFITLLSLDDARAWMDDYGAAACQRIRGALQRFLSQAEGLGYTDGRRDFPLELEKDDLRLVLDAPQGGETLAAQLQERGLDVEMCDDAGIVCILSLMDGEKRLKRLLGALTSLRAAEGKDGAPIASVRVHTPPSIPPRDMPLCQAAFAPFEAMPLAQTAGRISAGQAGLYPPGVAALTAGERVTEEIIAYLSTVDPRRVFGLNPDGTLNCVRQSKGVWS